MNRAELDAAVMQLLRALGKTPLATSSVTVEPDQVVWAGREGECVVTRTWHVSLHLEGDA